MPKRKIPELKYDENGHIIPIKMDVERAKKEPTWGVISEAHDYRLAQACAFTRHLVDENGEPFTK